MYVHIIAAMVDEALVNAAASKCMAAKVRRAARAVTALYDEKLRPSKLKVGQFTMLVALRMLRDPTVGRMAEALGMDRTTVTRNLKPLERDGLVSLSPGRTDGRNVTVKLTAAGTRRLDRALPLWHEAQRQIEAMLADRLDDVGLDLDVLGQVGRRPSEASD